jgi:hypothetical protein
MGININHNKMIKIILDSLFIMINCILIKRRVEHDCMKKENKNHLFIFLILNTL